MELASMLVYLFVYLQPLDMTKAAIQADFIGGGEPYRFYVQIPSSDIAIM